jgi:dienelactone hydrolase
MPKVRVTVAILVVLASISVFAEADTAPTQPETVVIHGKSVTLHALLWLPARRGPHPGILLLHGSGRSREELKRLGPFEEQAYILGPLFARHGYAFLYLFRRGVGLSADQGPSAAERMNAEASRGQAARNELQLRLLETDEMNDALAGLAFLRARPEVDGNNVSVVGHSFGGSLTILLGEREPKLRAIVVFSAAGYSWDRSPELRERLLKAAAQLNSPVFFIHAANDYSLAPGRALDARMKQLGKPQRLKIYPPIGKTPDDGHGFLYLGVNDWEPDVFAFLHGHMRK